MRVIVVGAGQVGSSIAADLAADHDVVVIDRDPSVVEELTYSLDVLTIEGDGTRVETLEEADVGEADIVIASTDDDEVNLVTCGTVKAVGDAFTVARVKQVEYLETWRRTEQAFGVDDMVCTNLLAAESIVRVAGLPAARDVEGFAGGAVRMAEFVIEEGSPVAGQTVRDADRFDSLTFVSILRGDAVEMVEGETVIRPGDRLVVIGSPESVATFAGELETTEHSGQESVVIVGGSEVGYHVARLLGEQGFRPRLIEQDRARARELAEELPDTLVMESDATDIGFLEREHVGDADILVSALDGDEKNLLTALLAGRLGVERTVAVIERPEYVNLFETVGVDVGINPRTVVAEEISRLTRQGSTEDVALIETGEAEVFEVEVDGESVLADRRISESTADLPASVVIGAITRDGELIVPRGDTVVEAGDHVVAFARADIAAEAASRL